MTDLYLRADSAAALVAALALFRSEDGNGSAVWRTASHSHALDVIGTLYEPFQVNSKGEVIGGGQAKPGYHANLRLFGAGEGIKKDIPASIILDPAPETPERIWA